MERLFLLRKSNNRIEGPFSKSEVLDQLESGQLGTHDEIGPAGAYWFQCHEGSEVERWVGSFERDNTIIEADDMTLTINRNVADLSQAAQPSARRENAIGNAIDDGDEVTDPMISGIASARNPTGAGAVSKLKPVEAYRIEGPSYWKWIGLILIPLIGLVVYRILGIARFF